MKIIIREVTQVSEVGNLSTGAVTPENIKSQPIYVLEIPDADEQTTDFLRTATTFMRRFLTGQYPPVRISK